MKDPHQIQEQNDNTGKDISKDVESKAANNNNNDKTGNHGILVHVVSKLRRNADFRRTYFTAGSLLWAYMLLGWTLAQMGPSFLDLQIITGTSLDQGSTYFAFHAGGYLLGSLVTGIIYDKIVYDKSLVIIFTQIGHTVVLVLIPWCTQYELMVLVHTIKGIFSGGFETCGNAHLMYVCGNENAGLMQALYFAFGLGGIVSPYAISPFLADESSEYLHLDDRRTDFLNRSFMDAFNLRHSNISNLTGIDTFGHVITGNITQEDTNISMGYPVPEESRLYIGYTITAALTLTSALPFCYLFISSKCVRETRKQVSKETENYQKFSKITKIFLLVVMIVIMGLYCGIEDSFNNFLATFCVKQLGWTKVDGATITSIYWASLSSGRFAGIFLISRFKPSKTSSVLCSIFLVCHIGFLFLSEYKYDVGVWISVVLIGLSSSVIFPLLFTWMEEDIVPVTGRVASILMIAASGGATVNPILLGYTMDNLTPMWLSYTLTLQTALSALLCFVILYNTLKSPNRKQERNNMDIHVNNGYVDDHVTENNTHQCNQREFEKTYVYSIRL